MTIRLDIGRTDVQNAVDEWIIGKNGQRDRQILIRRLIDGITYERIAEEFELSVPQVKRIIQKGTNKIYKHL